MPPNVLGNTAKHSQNAICNTSLRVGYFLIDAGVEPNAPVRVVRSDTRRQVAREFQANLVGKQQQLAAAHVSAAHQAEVAGLKVDN